MSAKAKANTTKTTHNSAAAVRPPEVMQDWNKPARKRARRVFEAKLTDDAQNGLSWYHLMDYMNKFKDQHASADAKAQRLDDRSPSGLKNLADDKQDANRSPAAIRDYARYRRQNIPQNKAADLRFIYPVELTSRQQNALAPLDLRDYLSEHPDDSRNRARELPNATPEQLRQHFTGMAQSGIAAYRRKFPPDPKRGREYLIQMDAFMQSTLTAAERREYCTHFTCGLGDDDFAKLPPNIQKEFKQEVANAPIGDDVIGLQPGQMVMDSTIRALCESLNETEAINNITMHILAPDVFAEAGGFPQTGFGPWKDYFTNAGVDFRGLHMLLAPANVNGNHWVLLVANMKKNIVVVIDPMSGAPSMKMPLSMARFITEHRNAMRLSAPQMQVGAFREVPTQANLFDCGIYTMMYAEDIFSLEALHKNLFTQADATERRKEYLGILSNSMPPKNRASLVRRLIGRRRAVRRSAKRPVLGKRNHYRYKRS